MGRDPLVAQIDAVRDDLDQAAETLFTAAEEALGHIAAARAGTPVPLDAMQDLLCRIIEGCAFQDLTGQRLDRIAALVGAASRPDHAEDSHGLLNGPALPGAGLDQAAADALFNSP